MKFLLIILFAFVSLHGIGKDAIFKLYQDERYTQACKAGLNAFKKLRNDEEFILLYAFSCLKSDNIDRLAIPIIMLKKTEESRANASYFSIILMQKKILFQALMDSYDFSNLKLPTTDYILSKVFDLYLEEKNKSKDKIYTFTDRSDNRLSYKLYIKKESSTNKMVVEEYYDTILLKRHVYW